MKKLPFIFLTLALFFFFTTPKIGLVSIHAQEETSNGNFEIISPENSIFCTDFRIKKSKTDSFSEAIGTNNQNVVKGATSEIKDDTGEIWLDNLEQPDFSLMENRLNSTLPKLLPKSLNESLNIGRSSLETETNHFINDDQAIIPHAKITLPEWWTAVLGESKVFCGLFQSCEPPQKLAIKVEQPDLKELMANLDKEKSVECEKSEIVMAEKPEIDNEEKRFTSKSLFSIIKEIIDDLINKLRTTTTTEETVLQNRTRGYLVGGKTLAEQSTFFSSFIPSDINSLIKNAPLSGPSQYGLDKDHSIVEEDKGDSEKINFQEQNLPKARYCLQLCSLYPPDVKFNISNIDPICISCNPKDYQN